MEEYQEPTPVENPLEDPDSPMEDAPPLEPQPVTRYEPDVPGGQTHTLSSKESPIEPWEAYLTQPSSPVSRKHSLSPTSSFSAPIRQLVLPRLGSEPARRAEASHFATRLTGPILGKVAVPMTVDST